MAFVLTPQDFSTSSLVFGPVLIHPRNTIPHAFQRSRIFLLIEMPTKYAKVRERDFVYFVFFAGKLGLTKYLLLFLRWLFYSKNDWQHFINLFHKNEFYLFLRILRHFH